VVMLPWEQPGLSEETRARMRALSQERAIFLAPPAGGHASFWLDLEASLPLLMEALAVDKHLEEQRHLLVPQQVTEDQFFTNYFHHLHVLARTGTCATVMHARTVDGRSVSSASPVLVSAADSEASDVASARELEKAPDAEEPHHASHGVTPPHSASTSNQVAPPLATLLADDATTPDRRPPANVRNVSLEEQFECVSNHLVASAQRSAAASRAAATTTQQTPARGDAAAAASSKPAQALTLDWEEELLAEL